MEMEESVRFGFGPEEDSGGLCFRRFWILGRGGGENYFYFCKFQLCFLRITFFTRVYIFLKKLLFYNFVTTHF